MKRLLTLSLLVALTITLFTACKDNSKTGPEYTSAYICPMHCEGSGSAEPGTCPVCNMAYVKNEDYKGDDHEGHDHGDHEGHDHGDMEEAQSQDSTEASENMDMEGDQEGDDTEEAEEEGGQEEEQ